MEAVFTFQTTRAAIGGEQALLSAGLKVKVMALPSALGAGCGLCLRVEAEELPSASRLLNKAGFGPEGMYYRDMASGRAIYRPTEERPE